MIPEDNIVFISDAVLHAQSLLLHQGGLFLCKNSFRILYLLLCLPHPAVTTGNLSLYFLNNLLQLRELNLFENHSGIFFQGCNIVPAVPDLLQYILPFCQHIHTIFDVCIRFR